MKIEDYDAKRIELKKKQTIYSAKKLPLTFGYSNLRSGDVSKFKLIHAKVKMIANKGGNNTALLCGIQRLKSYKNVDAIYSSQEGIYFFHYPNKHIYGCEKYDLKTDLKFDSNGECLTIQVDRTNDLLSFIDDQKKNWSIQLSKVVGEDPFVFSFEMYETNVEFQIQFFVNTQKFFQIHIESKKEKSKENCF